MTVKIPCEHCNKCFHEGALNDHIKDKHPHVGLIDKCIEKEKWDRWSIIHEYERLSREIRKWKPPRIINYEKKYELRATHPLTHKLISKGYKRCGYESAYKWMQQRILSFY